MAEKNEYHTKQKDAVLSYFRSHPTEHFTADSLTDELHRDHIPIGKTTVYRALCHLEKTGIIRKFTSASSDCACYQYAGDQTASCHTHLHLKCLACGKLYHVDCAHLSDLSMHLTAHHGFSVDYTRTVIYGTCTSCLSLYPQKTTADKETE